MTVPCPNIEWNLNGAGEHLFESKLGVGLRVVFHVGKYTSPIECLGYYTHIVFLLLPLLLIQTFCGAGKNAIYKMSNFKEFGV